MYTNQEHIQYSLYSRTYRTVLYSLGCNVPLHTRERTVVCFVKKMLGLCISTASVYSVHCTVYNGYIPGIVLCLEAGQNWPWIRQIRIICIFFHLWTTLSDSSVISSIFDMTVKSKYKLKFRNFNKRVIGR